MRTDVDCDNSIIVHDIRRLPFGINIDKKNHVVTDAVIDKEIPAIDAVATTDGKMVYLSIINQSLDEDCQLTLEVPGAAGKAARMLELYSDSILDANTQKKPDLVVPASFSIDAGQPIRVKKHSVNVIVLPR